jgi:hypothetical protein
LQDLIGQEGREGNNSRASSQVHLMGGRAASFHDREQSARDQAMWMQST